jgi:hypothetical protein
MNDELQNTGSFSRRYLSSANLIVPFYYFLLAIALAVPALFLGKSIRFFIALSALFFLPLFLKIVIKNAADRQWVFLLCSVTLLCVLTLISGTLLGLAIRLLLLIFILFFLIWLFAQFIFPSRKMQLLTLTLILTYLTYELYKFISANIYISN